MAWLLVDHGKVDEQVMGCHRLTIERSRLRASGMEAIMRNRLYVSLLLLAVSLGQIGCIVPIYSSSPDVRARQLIFVSEGYRHIPEIWDRIWGLEMPDVATPYRTHGGVI